MTDENVLLTVIEMRMKNVTQTRSQLEILRETVERLDGGTGKYAAQLAKLDARLQAVYKASRKNNAEMQSGDRSYRNVSTSIDDMIALKERESKVFSQSLRAQMQANTATNNLAQNLPRLRYALYDVSTSLTITGAAMLGFSAIALKTAIDYERQFADVIRTTGATGDAIGRMRQEFLELNSVLPVSFRDLARIGTLAGQLNIPTDDVAEFTELVAKFSATTDVTVDAAATAFGRLSELLGLNADQFENLGSSILGVGVNSVATESAIIAISTQLAGVANQSGLTADELIGLSAALASVGIQPELARGTITRLFGQISRAIAIGGENLENFGTIANMSGADFASGWRNAPVDTLLAFFDGVRDRGGEAEAALREVGITSVRDVPAILRLAQTMDSILVPSLQIAADEFVAGTELQEQYGIIAETTAEKLQVLVNNFQLLLNALGQGAIAFKPLIDFVSTLLRGLTALASNPVGNFFVVLTVGVTALSGVILVLGGLLARAGASAFAFRTALVESAVAAGAYSTAAEAASVSTLKLATGIGGATAATRGFSVALKGLLASTGVGLGLVAIALAIEAIGGAAQDAQSKAERFFADTGSFAAAVKQDTEAYLAGADAIKVFSVSLDQSVDPTERATENTRTWLGVQGEVSATADDATGAVREQTIAIGENAEAWLRNALAQSEAFVNLANNPEALNALEAVGGNIDDFIQASLQGRGEAYARGLLEPIAAEISRLSAQDIGGDAFNAARISELDAQYRALSAALLESGIATDALVESTRRQAAANDLAGASAASTTEDFEALRGAMDQLVADIFQGVNDARAFDDAMFNLGETLFQAGADAAFTSESFQDAIGTIASQSGGAQDAANNLQGFFNALVAGGFASEAQLDLLRQTIEGLLGLAGPNATARATGAFDVSALTRGFDEASRAARRTSTAAREVREEVRTLVDYANDLQKVFSRAFDIRFGSQSALDDLNDSWETLNKRVRDARIELQQLTADRNVKEYFLSVAEAYGDELRAGVLRGEIAEINEKMAETQADASTELEGNSKAARQNRSVITGLVKNYQDYITALAESGADQAALNAAVARSQAEFLAQAQALGFSNQQLQPYIASFRDMTTVINNVPRNITVTGNADPAIQALNEFEAALNSARANAARGISVPAPVIPTARYETIRLNASDVSLYRRALESGTVQGYLQGQNFFRYLGTYATGGYTGRGGKYEPAGIVHKGEYVIPKSQVNQSTGLPYANALGGQMPSSRGASYAGGGFVGGGGMGNTIMVELSAYDRKLLAQAGNVQLMLDGQTVARATNRANTLQAQRGTN